MQAVGYDFLMASIGPACSRAETAPKTRTNWADAPAFAELTGAQPVLAVHFLWSIFTGQSPAAIGMPET
jgi:hypothetical protein